ncbi:hypothetical protein [Methylobacterium sp. J-070]|uniref:hypothetical protein n=1 Tax=Methylobacterium sp. J-070 TaxID=2836650 RepID=UPI001FBA51B6|nr:hypothetical protein [Methylobacterium sp. J-070]MCJ2053962.1 hypothetical protein [Methylobacterium sp. J-070]
MLGEFDPMSEVVEALRALGHTVVPNADFDRWQVDEGEWLTSGDLLSLAIRLGLLDSPWMLQ